MSNSRRALRQVVSVDGWIATFDADDTAAVHADVVFREGSFGAKKNDKVRFRVTLARAEIVLVVPAGEPLKIIKSSIRRTPPPEASFCEVTRLSSAEARGKGEIALSSLAIPRANVRASGEAQRSISMQERSTVLTSGIKVQHVTTQDPHPGWEVQALEQVGLRGVPWDAGGEPRLRVGRTAKRNRDGDKPTMRIEVRCRREDLLISDLSLKDEKKQSMFKRKRNNDVNLAAAEQIIKEELISAGFLHMPDLSEDFAEFVIADAVIFEEWDG